MGSSYRPSRWLSWPAFAILALVALLATGCVGVLDNSVTLSRDERWVSDAQLTVSQQEIQMAGGEQVLNQNIQQQFAQQQALANSLGVRLTQSRSTGPNNSVVFSFHSEGQGIDSLNRFIFGGTALTKTVQNGDIHIQFGYTPVGVRAYSLRLTAGKLISSNGTSAGNTATWPSLVQLGRAQAEFVFPAVHPATAYQIAFLKDDRWQAEARLVVPPYQLASINDQGSVDSQIRQMQQPMLDRAKKLSLTPQQRQDRGGDGSAVYVLATRGQGLDGLNQLLFDGRARIQDVGQTGAPKVHFEYGLPSPTGQPFSLSVRGQQIVGGNADQAAAGQATWQDLAKGGTAQVDLTPVQLVPNIDETITLSGEEKWIAETRLSVTPADISSAGGEGTADADVQQAEQPMLDQARGLNVTVQQRKEHGSDGSLVYVYTSQGQGLDVLNKVLYQGNAKIQKAGSSSRSQVHFEYAPCGRLAGTYALHLKTGKILGGNADESSGGQATWRDLVKSGTARADVDMAADMLLWWIGGLIGVVVALGGLGFVLVRRRGARVPAALALVPSQVAVEHAIQVDDVAKFVAQTPSAAEPGVRVCPNCGNRNPADANFCMQCRTRLVAPD